MLQRANELAGNELLPGRQAVKLAIGLTHVLILEVQYCGASCFCLLSLIGVVCRSPRRC